jgi:DNA-binding response OmpR family regulator
MRFLEIGPRAPEEGMPKVLIVEDDEAMSTALRDGFAYEGYEVCVARDGASGLRMASDESPDVVILDVMLPKMSGLDICKQIRKDGNSVPILMLTARGQEIDKVLGLKLGADDYVTKPFGFLELMARVEAVLRRGSALRTPLDSYRFGEVEVDFKKGEARRKVKRLELSPRELRLLEYFVRHRGEIVAGRPFWTPSGATTPHLSPGPSTCTWRSCARRSRIPAPSRSSSSPCIGWATSSRDDPVPSQSVSPRMT